MGKKGDEEVKGADEQVAREFAQYDLLHKMTPFLDRHLVSQMLLDALESGVYRKEDVTEAIVKIAFEAFLPYPEVMEWLEGLCPSIGQMEQKWNFTLADYEASESKVMPLLQCLEDETKVQKIKDFKHRSEMCDVFEITPDVVEELVRYAKKLFTAGKYDVSHKLLSYYMNFPQADPCFYIIKYAGAGEVVGFSHTDRDDAEEAFERLARSLEFGRKNDKDADKDPKCVILTGPETDSADASHEFTELMFHGKSRERIPELRAWWEKEVAQKKAADVTKQRELIWGSLVSAILLSTSEKTDQAPAEVSKLIIRMDDHLSTSEAPQRDLLLQRTWLLHWTLFAIFRMEPMDMKACDFFLAEKSLSVISLSCPHLFRYVGACLILQKRLKHIVKETVWIIHHEASSYSDPITRFLLALYTEMDYDEAQQELQRCEQLCKGDYFLKPHWQDFQENARLHIFESYCRIHQCINIQMIAEKLNMQAEEAELWIVNLIRNAKLDARIDSEKSRVVMTKAPPNVYQQVIEKTKNLGFRTTLLVSNLEKH